MKWVESKMPGKCLICGTHHADEYVDVSRWDVICGECARRVASVVPRVVCERCGKGFLNKGQLLAHHKQCGKTSLREGLKAEVLA